MPVTSIQTPTAQTSTGSSRRTDLARLILLVASALMILASTSGCRGRRVVVAPTPAVTQAPPPRVVAQPAAPAADALFATPNQREFAERLFHMLQRMGYSCRPEPNEPAVTIFCERADRFRTFFRYTYTSNVARLVLSVRFSLRSDCGNITPLVNATNWEYNATTFTCRDSVLESRSVLLVPEQGLTASVLDRYLGWWAEMTREQARATGMMGFVE